MEDKKLTIIVDVDDTLNHCTEHWVKVLNEEHGTKIRVEDIEQWNGTSQLLAEAKGISLEEADRLATSIFNRKGFFLTLKPNESALKHLKRLHDEGHTIIIATRPPLDRKYSIPDKRLWLKTHLPEIFGSRRVRYTADKFKIKGDILIDDSDHNILKSKGIHITIAPDKPWNRHAQPDYRCKDWNEIYRAVKKVSTNRR